MCAGKMHADEVDIDASLVARLLAAQFPKCADLPLTSVQSAGTDNAMFRLGEDMAVRLPRIPSAVDDVHKEQQLLPALAPHLPLDIPHPLAKGAPGEGYPWHWSIYRWLEGETATIDRIGDPYQLAVDLAQFVTALHEIDTEGLLPVGPLGSYRGGPLTTRDGATRAAIAELDGMVDVGLVTEAWEAALQVPVTLGPPVWIHGDLQSGNLLSVKGRLSAVIDFGCLAVGDPAVDLIAAWNLLSAETRDAFRAALPVDDATWARGRGWALSLGLIALPYYQNTNPVLAGIARYAIDATLADHDQS